MVEQERVSERVSEEEGAKADATQTSNVLVRLRKWRKKKKIPGFLQHTGMLGIFKFPRLYLRSWY